MENNKITKYIRKKTKDLTLNLSKGFTLVETMVAVFIIGMITTSLLGVIATSLYNFRYSQNEMVATYLLQEAADYIRNHRDTELLRTPINSTDGWNIFSDKYNDCRDRFCKIDTTKNIDEDFIEACSFGECDSFYFNSSPEEGEYFYSYNSENAIPTTIKRSIRFQKVTSNEDTMKTGGSDEIRVEVFVEWKNGNLTRNKKLVFTLLRWLS